MLIGIAWFSPAASRRSVPAAGTQLLHTADPTFPTFPTSDGVRTGALLDRCRAMAAAGAVRLLTDGHHHTVYDGRDVIVGFLQTLLFEHDHFQAVLRTILDTHDGLTVAEIHAQLRRRRGDPVVHHYLSLEFPYLPMSLQQIIVVSLLQVGYTSSGRHVEHRFHRPVSGSADSRLPAGPSTASPGPS